MTPSKTAILIFTCTNSVLAFVPQSAGGRSSSLLASSLSDDRPLYDPLNLYGEKSTERQNGRIRALEPQLIVRKPIIDPLNLYSDKSLVDKDVDMSEALPFVARPISLTRNMAGDVGFDPFNFAATEENLLWQRQAELKHARIAMLAAVGWPLSELWDKQLATMWHLKPLLVDGDRVPSLLNGGLANVSPLYWITVLGVVSAIELKSSQDQLASPPADLYRTSPLDQAEIQNGRLAMMAIVGFAVQEFISKIGVIDQTPIFFHPISQYFEIFANHAASM